MPNYLVAVAPQTAPNSCGVVQSLYLLAGAQLSTAAVERLAVELLHDPVVQQVAWRPLTPENLIPEPFGNEESAARCLEIAYRPGVTDNEGESVLEGARRLEITGLEQARALRRHLLSPDIDPQSATRDLANDLVQTALAYPWGGGVAERLAFYSHLLAPPAAVPPHITRVPLRAADDAELMRISRAGILALDLHEMRTIRNYYSEVGRDPTDGELETIAQTWSEHCSHKTFKARINYRVDSDSVQASDAASLDPALYSAFHLLQQDCEIDSLIRTFLMAATEKVLEQRTHETQDWVLSAFVDNAGIIAFTDDYEVSFKVETHNHPSALEPFGGANTGVGGVIRDVLGVSALPIANTDVLCFGPPDLSAQTLAPGVLHPRRVCAGVVAGVRDYGNKLGIPTVNGAVLFDPGYTANPLVFCGTVGLAPRGAHPRNVQSGDAIVVLGGRTGRDGIHGATFSSEELSHTTATDVGSAVQIGDPITEKKTLDVLLQARDRGLYSAITDCGAGGLSSAVGEMGAETGATVELERTPLKYAGLQPWEIWLSEAQERMVLAAPPQHLAALLELCRAEDVEATAIGHFTSDKLLRVIHSGQTLVEIDMGFLHDGRPQRALDAVWSPAPNLVTTRSAQNQPDDVVTLSAFDSDDLATILLSLLAHPNIASKERIIRTYDHEVGGATVIKPLVGVDGGPGDAAVLQPLRRSNAGLALGCGINPRYGRIDPYWMALACVDEALRNVVAVGGDPQRTAILDNFCWGDPRQPDRMAGLVRAAAGCYDAAVAFGAPFISGKDSLNNEYRDAQGDRVAIPPTLLISALAYVPDVRQTLTMDLKEVGNSVYLLGATRDELAGSHVLDLGLLNDTADHSNTEQRALQLPRVDLAAARQTFAALHQAIRAGLVRACHDLNEGGLAVATAEMTFAGMRGLELDLSRIELSDQQADIPDKSTSALISKLFSETPSRFFVEVRPQDAAAFEAKLNGVSWVRLGRVTAAPELWMLDGNAEVLRIDLAALKTAWQRGLEEVEL